MFVREEGDAYCCLGRLQVISHKLDVHPVELVASLTHSPTHSLTHSLTYSLTHSLTLLQVWQLVDYEKIKDTKEFKSILEVARVM